MLLIDNTYTKKKNFVAVYTDELPRRKRKISFDGMKDILFYYPLIIVIIKTLGLRQNWPLEEKMKTIQGNLVKMKDSQPEKMVCAIYFVIFVVFLIILLNFL